MFFDIHAHIYKYPYPTETGDFLMSTPEQVKQRYRELNITGAAILPILGPELYVPQSIGEVIDMANDSDGAFVPSAMWIREPSQIPLTHRSEFCLSII